MCENTIRSIIEHRGDYKNFSYFVSFIYPGYRCGYVTVPHNHKLFGKECENIVCHGGISYSGINYYDKQSSDWIIGFDCAYYGDAYDKESFDLYFSHVSNKIPHPSERLFCASFGTVKTLDFCKKECQQIIEQLL